MLRRLAPLHASLVLFLEHTATRLVLSLLILVSVLPLPQIDELWWLLFALFSLELLVRIGAFYRAGRPGPRAALLLLLDLLATLAFLPVHLLGPEARLLRLVRLLRLIDYWSLFLGDLWHLTARPERRRQLVFVVFTVLFLCGTSAVFLHHLGAEIDADADGRPDPEARGFAGQMWWAFRQIESPDNLVRQPRLGLTFLLSVGLTIAGFFVFSFFIGIGASLVADLVEASRRHRVGFRDHVVVLNPSPDCALLLAELCRYYRKQLRAPRVAVLGADPEVPDFLRRREIGGTRYRSGSSAAPADLARVDVERARRVLVLKHARHEVSDSEVISSVLTVREMNPEAVIYAEVRSAESAAAVRFAGGERSHALLTRELQGLLLANLVIAPELRPVLEELLSSQGQEIYTAVYGERMLAGEGPVARARTPPFAELAAIAGERYGVQLLGTLGAGAKVGLAGAQQLRGLPPEGPIGGLIGLTDAFPAIRTLARDLALGRLRSAPPAAPVELPALLPARDGRRRRVLLCGFQEPALILAEQLALGGDGVDLTVLLAGAGEPGAVRDELLTRTPRSFARRELEFHDAGADRFTIRRLRDGVERGSLRLLAGAWWLAATLSRHVFEQDAVIVLSDPDAADPDARPATALVNLARLLAESPARLPRRFQVLGLFKDRLKAEVLDRRFAALSSTLARPGLRVDLVSSDRLRNEYLAQAAMVPGIESLFGTLLSQGGEQILRLVPDAPPAGRMDFLALRRGLTPRGLVPIALELEREGAAQTAVNPRPGDPCFSFSSGELRAVIAVGPAGAVAASG